jgi:hypothetical protein
MAEKERKMNRPDDEAKKMPPTTNADTADAGPKEGDDTTASVEKIREIIFGSQMQEYDKRFSRLEHRLMEAVGLFRDDAGGRIKSLEEYVRKEIAALLDRVKTEHAQRIEVCKAISEDLKELTRTQEARAAKLAEEHSGAQRDLREQILSLSKDLREELQRRCDSIANAANDDVSELRAGKLDRAAVCELLTEAASRLAADEILAE